MVLKSLFLTEQLSSIQNQSLVINIYNPFFHAWIMALESRFRKRRHLPTSGDGESLQKRMMSIEPTTGLYWKSQYPTL